MLGGRFLVVWSVNGREMVELVDVWGWNDMLYVGVVGEDIVL